MEAGKLEHLIDIAAKVSTDTGGDVIVTYTPLGSIWCNIISQKGYQAFESAKVNARQLIRVQMRYRTDLNAGDRITWNGYVYSIIAPIDRSEQRKGFLWVTAQAVGEV